MSSKQYGNKRSAPGGGGSSSGPKGKFAKTSASSNKFTKPNSKGKAFTKPKSGNKNAPAANHNGGSGGHPKSRSNPREEEVKRRKRPITSGGGEEDADMSGDDDEGEEDYEVVPVEADDDGDVAMDVVALGDGEHDSEEKKPRMSKAEKAALHAAQPHRTSLLPSHPLLHDTLLPLWETARKADLSKEERKAAIAELWGAVKGRVGEVSRGHKGGRVLQTIVKYGGKEERLGVAMELEPQWRAMMESKYSKFLMKKLIRYCPSIRPLLIPKLTPHLQSLLSHAYALDPLADFYDLWASPRERRLLVRGFYPKEVQIFDGAKQGIEVTGLEGTLDGMGDGKGRERVLDGIEKTVIGVFNATQKTALTQAIFHRLVIEYLTCVYKFLDAEIADQKMHELLTAALESLPEIVHTKDGSAVVRELIARGNAKDRKSILQQLRKHLEAMCKDGDAQMVLFTAFDCVDDTKLMGKAIVTDIVALAATLAFDKQARRVLLYLLVPTATRHFIPSTLQTLSLSATIARESGMSKKDPVVRRKELLSYASEGLLQLVGEKGEEMVRDPGAGLLVQEIMVYAVGDKTKAIDALVGPLSTPYPDPAPLEQSPDPITSHPLDLSHSTRTYKTLLSGGHYSTATSSVTIVDPALSQSFAVPFWNAVNSSEAGGAENVKRICKGNAPFVVVELVRALKGSEVDTQMREVLMGKDVVDAISASVRKGADLLKEVIAGL